MLRMRFAVASILYFFLIFTASAQEKPLVNMTIGIADMQGIIQRSQAIAAVREALDEQNLEFQKKISAEELKLRQEERKLNQDESIISKEEYNRRRKIFEEKVVAVQQTIQLQKRSFDLSIQNIQSSLNQELLEIISEIAQEKQLDLVLGREDVILYNQSLDVTDEALTRLNERTKNLTLTRQDLEQ